jgi:hypothetical protein
MEAGKVPIIYIHDQYCRDIDQKNNAFKVVIDIGLLKWPQALYGPAAKCQKPF